MPRRRSSRWRPSCGAFALGFDMEILHVFARARGTRPHGDKMGGRTVFRLLLQNGWVKHRDLLRVFGNGVMQQESSVGTV